MKKAILIYYLILAGILPLNYQAADFARQLGLDSHLKLLGEASRKGVPQVFIDIDGRELFLPKK